MTKIGSAMFASHIKRREIRHWFAEHISLHNYICDHCDTAIPAFTIYHRRVIAVGDRIEVERVHARPDCPSRAY